MFFHVYIYIYIVLEKHSQTADSCEVAMCCPTLFLDAAFFLLLPQPIFLMIISSFLIIFWVIHQVNNGSNSISLPYHKTITVHNHCMPQFDLFKTQMIAHSPAKTNNKICISNQGKEVSKVGDRSRGQQEGSLFNSYYSAEV